MKKKLTFMLLLLGLGYIQAQVPHESQDSLFFNFGTILYQETSAVQATPINLPVDYYPATVTTAAPFQISTDNQNFSNQLLINGNTTLYMRYVGTQLGRSHETINFTSQGNMIMFYTVTGETIQQHGHDTIPPVVIDSLFFNFGTILYQETSAVQATPINLPDYYPVTVTTATPFQISTDNQHFSNQLLINGNTTLYMRYVGTQLGWSYETINFTSQGNMIMFYMVTGETIQQHGHDTIPPVYPGMFYLDFGEVTLNGVSESVAFPLYLPDHVSGMTFSTTHPFEISLDDQNFETELTVNSKKSVLYIRYHATLAGEHYGEVVFQWENNSIFAIPLYGSTKIESGQPANIIHPQDIFSIQVYPNPVSELLRIESSLTIEEVKIFNSLGQQVFSIRSSNTIIEVNTENFSKGIYFVQVKTDEGIKTKKILVIK